MGRPHRGYSIEAHDLFRLRLFLRRRHFGDGGYMGCEEMIDLKRVRFAQAIKAERGANKETWKSCLWCWQVAGNYNEGVVKGLASDMGKSDDTVYARAHAYQIFVDLCNFDGGRHRFFVHSVRRLPWVYWSHFRELWDLKRDFKLETHTLFDILMEMYQSEGMSVRDMEGIVRGKLGKDRPWTYYAERARREMNKTIGQPNTPRKIRVMMKKIIHILDGKTGKPNKQA